MRWFSGIAASVGIGTGRPYVLFDGSHFVARVRIESDADRATERARFASAIGRIRAHFESLRKSLTVGASHDVSLILQAQLEMLGDPYFNGETLRRIAAGQNAESAVWDVWKDLARTFDGITDEYLKTRSEDVRHLVLRLIEELRGADAPAMGGLGTDSVVVAHSLAPDRVIAMCRVPVAGIVTATGSPVSHAAIVARTFGVPAVVGVANVVSAAEAAHWVAVDGGRGRVLFDPTPKEQAEIERDRRKLAARRARIEAESILAAETPDGHGVLLLANCELPEDIPGAVARGADGVGLYRTEYLFLGRDDLPTVAEMAAHYTRAVRALGGRPVTFRTVDLGGDKAPRSLGLGRGENPAMGLRGIRLSLKRRDLFRDQIRAVLAASEVGPVRILLPMISSGEELDAARDEIATVARDVGAPIPPIGVMIETPASVTCADVLARSADFFSVGTNDLIQYALAVDRTDETVSYLYAPLHLAVLRMLKTVADVGREAGVEVGVCGEMAGDPMFTLVLLGLGMRSLSMAAVALPTIRAMIRSTPLREARELVQGILALKDPAEVRRVLEREVARRYPDLVGESSNA